LVALERIEWLLEWPVREVSPFRIALLCGLFVSFIMDFGRILGYSIPNNLFSPSKSLSIFLYFDGFPITGL